jgi:hypothetical protein
VSNAWLRSGFVAAVCATALSGCAVLTIDVDVYKGALANHESVQTEQLAAMAMGAKVLIAELRTQLEWDQCKVFLTGLEDKRSTLERRTIDDEYPRLDQHCPAYFRVRRTARFLADLDSVRSRDTTRVNGILSLYENAPEARGSHLVRNLQDRLRDMAQHIDDGVSPVRLWMKATLKDLTLPKYSNDRAAAQHNSEKISKLSLAAIEEGLKPPCDGTAEERKGKSCPEIPAHVDALARAWRSAREAWREAMRLLSSEPLRGQLGPEALDAVAWVGATLTSPAGLTNAIVDIAAAEHPAAEARRQAEEARRNAEQMSRAASDARQRADLAAELAASAARTQESLAADRALLTTQVSDARAAEGEKRQNAAAARKTSNEAARAAAMPEAAAALRTAALAAAEAAARAEEHAALARRTAADLELLLDGAKRRLVDAEKEVGSLRTAAEKAASERQRVESESKAAEAARQTAEHVAATHESKARMLRTAELPAMVLDPGGPFAELRRRVPAVSDGTLRRLSAEERRRAERTIRGALSELLQDPNLGRPLATQLLVAEAHAEAQARERFERGDIRNDTLPVWFATLFPSADAIKDFEETRREARANAEYLLGLTHQVFDSGLGGGRIDAGLEKLIAEYLKANGEARSSRDRREVELKRGRLLDALVNFGEKIAIIANLDILLRGSRPLAERDPFASTVADKYVRLLQAVGNSILSQVDALKQVAAHRDRLEDGRVTEIKGLRNAEARAAAALKQMNAEIEAVLPKSEVKSRIIEALTTTQTNLETITTRLAEALKDARLSYSDLRNVAARWATADEVLRRPTVKQAVDAYAPADATLTVDGLAQHLVTILNKWEGQARLPGGDGDAEAGRLEVAAAILLDKLFKPQNDKATAPKDQLPELLRILGRERNATRKKEVEQKPVVDGLERWHATASSLASGSRALMLPGDLEERPRPDATSKDVLDVMLTTLRYEHVAAVANDRDSELSKNRLAAVELLYAYRSGLIHIRPSSTFLRNSYPATVLQNDPSAGVWRNMLTDHAKRQLPFYATIKGQQEEAQITKTIDKQFWQSVNQVRVAGAGNTNYAIAKDDVGNWYVKDYGSDPSDIIRSAKNLAMFASGPALGANFLARGGAATREPLAPPTRPNIPVPVPGEATPTAPTPPAATPTPRATLGRQLDRYAERYEKETRHARDTVKTDVEAIHTKVQLAMKDAGMTSGEIELMDKAKVFEALATALPQDRSLGELGQDNDTTTGRPKGVAALNRDIAAALRAMKRYRNTIVTRMQAIPSGTKDSPGPDEKRLGVDTPGKAKAAVDTALRELIQRHLDERKTSASVYESALLFIGETAGL